MNKEYLLFQKDVNISGLGKLYIPKAIEVFEMGEKKFSELNLPYFLTTDYLDVPKEDLKITNFDLFFLITEDGKFLFQQNGKSLLQMLEESLKYYFKVDDVGIDFKTPMIILNPESTELRVITSEKFEEIADIVLKINCTKRVPPLKIKNANTARKRDIMEKIMKGRSRNKEKNAVHFDEMISIVRYGGSSIIPYDEIKNETWMQFVNDYNNNFSHEYYNGQYDLYIAGVKPNELDLEHWSKKINS